MTSVHASTGRSCSGLLLSPRVQSIRANIVCSRPQHRQHAAPAARRNAVDRAVGTVRVQAAAASYSGDVAKPGNPFLNVVLPTALALMVCNMDRICLSVAIMPMAQEFGWSTSLQGIIQSAFLWGYTASGVLGGSLADRYGGKVVMAAGIAWFSLASVLLPLALSPTWAAAGFTLPLVLAARTLVGFGEGVALPCMNNLVATHIPKAAKARGLGLCFSGFHSGNLLGLLLSPLLLLNFGWRGLFLVFGLLGGPLLMFWLATVPDKSAAVAAAAELPVPAPPPSSATTLSLLSKTATWAIIVVNVVNHWGYFIYLNWMPTYFVKVLGFDLRSSSFTALLPWVVMAVGSSLSGWLADTLVSQGNSVTQVRKVLQTVAFLVPAAALLLLSQPGISPAMAVACLTGALGATSLGQAGFVANMSDIAPRHAGKMFGLCNTFGSLSAITGVTAVGFIVERTQSFNPVFQLTACMYVGAVIVWNLFCTGEKVFD